MDNDQSPNITMRPGQKLNVVTATATATTTTNINTATSSTSTIPNIKGFPKTPKTLTEHKLKRLNILTFINDKKNILFTKKAFKHEKERIWRQIFHKMLEFGMVSKEKDWRYVRDVSFSNWRKRAQKRLKHLAANGFRLNMDECEFLIYDILGKTPDKSNTTNLEAEALFSETWPVEINNDDDENMDDESDEYMIDSDEEDEDDVSFDEMLFVPKIVLSDNLSDDKDSVMKQAESTSSIMNNGRQLSGKEMPKSNDDHSGLCKPDSSKLAKNGSVSIANGNGQQQQQQRHYSNKCYPIGVQQMQQTNQQQQHGNQFDTIGNHSNNKCSITLSDLSNFETGSDQEIDRTQSSPNRYMNKFRELRLLDLEIENKVLKNRLMKLKIYQLESNLGLEHCKEVKELNDFSKGVQSITNNNEHNKSNNISSPKGSKSRS